MNKYITIISYSLVLSYLPDTVYAQACFSAPSCQSLGYTKTIASCPEGINYLLCPYDSTYIYCPENCNLFPLSDGECDSSIGVCEQCSDTSKWRYISCNDGWYKKNDKCVENECYGYSPEQPNITGCSKINTCKKANQTYYENICSSCETGYELKDGECEVACSYTNTSLPTGCASAASCSKDGTTYYSSTCSSCYTGYSLSGGTCNESCTYTGTSTSNCSNYYSCKRGSAYGTETYYYCSSCNAGYEKYRGGCSYIDTCSGWSNTSATPYTEEECIAQRGPWGYVATCQKGTETRYYCNTTEGFGEA